VARFITKIDLEPIILHEQPNNGKTLFEKFETNSNDVGFAIVLLTPDDTGGLKQPKPSLKDRARQNVIFELGYFFGKLGRSRVCALHKGSVELPSDFYGIVYVQLDDAGGWQLNLAKELNSAGYNVDLNKVIS
jgi:predicted nucleotide-binding protein